MFTFAEVIQDAKDGASLERLHKKYGGFSLYIPQQRVDYKELIKEEFNGYNYDQLAYKYNTTPKNVRQVLNDDEKKNKPEPPSLFG